ncbi:schwannomin-interacting protein 1 homolog isoform X2 [Glossina fuscipes]|uniref:Schwannomin-interacting protein 1 homolog isoform X2 n=1 Tax=Glossina fuscipes TaxID=7396 RepID=A0A8U0WEE1_9MUSC|nr:schwannomin-interacting protein 1 homolog isoform X2 [Glossina fuscipes]
MRVPDIPVTAGYAAQSHNTTTFGTHYQGDNKTGTNKSFLSVLGGEQIKYENLPKEGNQYQDRQALGRRYSSSADEFVQKALNSSPSEYTPHRFNYNLTTPHYCCGALPPEAEKEQFDDFSNNDAQNSTGNTYKSFKEIFSTNKTFFEDCVRDFENINILRQQSAENVNDTDWDPIEFINLHETDPNDQKCDLYGDQQSSTLNIHQQYVMNSDRNETEQVQNSFHTTERSEKTISGSARVYEQDLDDNEYDDQSMIDLASETKSFYDSDERDDDFLTSASSSSGSLQTPKRSYFPRGIINPNYPGFQHLAHTLSEHFVNSSPSDSYDSDMSEYEMELSADSFDSLVEERSQKHLNLYNNNTPQSIMSPFSEEDTRLEFVRGKEQNEEKTENESYYQLCTSDVRHRGLSLDEANKNSNQNLRRGVDVKELQENLENALTLLDSSTYGQTSNKIPDISITPDILIKNAHLTHIEFELKQENRPDLLRGVSPQPHRKVLTENSKKPEETKTNPVKTETFAFNGGYNTRNQEIRDEISLGLTPVDIIGDFGQEVEREFGLLVSGYRRLVDAKISNKTPTIICAEEKVSDATLSVAKDQIDSSKYLEAFNKRKEDHKFHISNDLPDDNAVDMPERIYSTESFQEQIKVMQTSAVTEKQEKPRYQKSSYDERQLPPVAIEYKRCQQSVRFSKKAQSNEKPAKSGTIKATRNHYTKPSIASRLLHPKRGNKNDKNDNTTNRKREDTEFHQYQQLISDKEQILSNSKYAKLSSWAQYLKNSVKDHNSRGNSADLLSPSALDLFDAYKIGTEIDTETLQKHLKMAKEIEKKRRNDREEIRRRLAMGTDGTCQELPAMRSISWRPNSQSQLQNDFTRVTEIASDTETNSSDSETCPKLSKTKVPNNSSATFSAATVADKSLHPYHGRPLTVSCSNNISFEPYSKEDMECDFFTKQAKLQIEARMALAQAKEMAHMQMEIDRQNQRVSPITEIVRNSLQKIGIRMSNDKRRVSRQMLTELNIAQLQILVNNLHTHIEELNETLVNYLMERDDFHVNQDSMLVDIEELTRYIGAKEHIAQQERISITSKCSK